MSKILVGLLAALALVGQNASQNFSVSSPSAATIIGSTYGNHTTTSTTYYYWLLTNYTVGTVVDYNPESVTGIALGDPSVAHPILISFNPITGPISYSVVRASTPVLPTFPCTCLVGTVLVNSTNSVLDNGSALGALAPVMAKPAYGDLRLNNMDYGVPTFEYVVNGSATPFSSGGAGANINGHYLVTTTVNAPVNAVSLGLLASGLLKIGVLGGIATPAIAVQGDILGLLGLSVGSSGTAPNWSLSTLHIPLASTGGVTAGTLSNVDYLTFMGKQDAITPGTNLQYVRGDFGIATFPLALPPNGPATGDLSSTYPNPVVSQIGGIPVNPSGATPGQVLGFNGAAYVPLNPASSVGGSGLTFFKDDVPIIGTGTNNTQEVNTDRTTPDVVAEVVDSLSAVSNTVVGEAYLYNTSLGITTIPSGIWTVNLYASVNSTVGGRVSTLTNNVFTVTPYVTNLTTSGAGATRTATATSGIPFCTTCIVANANPTLASFLQTPQGLYQITVRTSDTVVTIVTPTTYANESPATTYGVWKKLFGVTTPAITATGTNYTLISSPSAQASFTVVSGSKLGDMVFATSNNTTTINYTHNGTTHYSNIQTPITTSGGGGGAQGVVNTIQTSNGAGGFVDSGATLLAGQFSTGASTFEFAGGEKAKPSAPASGGDIWFDSTAHLPQYQGVGGTVIGSMVQPTSCTNQFVRAIPNTGVPTCASIASADMPNPGASALGGVQSIDCTGTGHILKISTSGVPSCSADSGGGATPVYKLRATFVNSGTAVVAGAVGYYTSDTACTIGSFNIRVDTGTASFDVWKIATGTALPTITNTIISGASYLAISTGTNLHSTTLTGLTTTTVSANDVLGFKLQAVTGSPTTAWVELICQ